VPCDLPPLAETLAFVVVPIWLRAIPPSPCYGDVLERVFLVVLDRLSNVARGRPNLGVKRRRIS
jgi:hypothetical protein